MNTSSLQALPALSFAPYRPGDPVATLNEGVKVVDLQIPSELGSLFFDSKSIVDDRPFTGIAPESWCVSKRCSKKQLWFFAFRSKEITGQPFSTLDVLGNKQDYPTSFCIGQWPDGSFHFVRISPSQINGPFWLHFTYRMISAKP